MGSVNKVILVGNLGRDAEMRFTTGGTAVISVGLATTDHYKDRDGNKREDTQWHTVVIWGKTAEVLQPYLTKGKQIYVEGKLQTREWTDKEGGKRKATEVRADRITLLGGGDGQRGGTRSRRDAVSEPVDDGFGGTDVPPDDDEVPF